MRLVDLHGEFLSAGGEGVSDAAGSPVPLRTGVGVQFDCPCGCDSPVYVDFANPLDGGPPLRGETHVWQREGETIEALTLTPSILRKNRCGWHGYIRNGGIVNA